MDFGAASVAGIVAVAAAVVEEGVLLLDDTLSRHACLSQVHFLHVVAGEKPRTGMLASE